MLRYQALVTRLLNYFDVQLIENDYERLYTFTPHNPNSTLSVTLEIAFKLLSSPEVSKIVMNMELYNWKEFKSRLYLSSTPEFDKPNNRIKVNGAPVPVFQDMDLATPHLRFPSLSKTTCFTQEYQ